jgi:hypothetical protein
MVIIYEKEYKIIAKAKINNYQLKIWRFFNKDIKENIN